MMLVSELIAELQRFSPSAEIKVRTAVWIDDDEDWVAATIEGVSSEGAGLVILDADGMSDDDKEALAARDAEYDEC